MNQPVETRQIAPTILRLLGLDPQALKSVHAEGTRELPDATRRGPGVRVVQLSWTDARCWATLRLIAQLHIPLEFCRYRNNTAEPIGWSQRSRRADHRATEARLLLHINCTPSVPSCGKPQVMVHSWPPKRSILPNLSRSRFSYRRVVDANPEV